jgi:2'-5' RNA ligase
MRPFLYGLDLVTNFGSERNPAVVVCGDEGIPGLLMLQAEIAMTMRRIGFRPNAANRM